MATIETIPSTVCEARYEIDPVTGRVKMVKWDAGAALVTATVSPENPDMYIYESTLDDDEKPVRAPMEMSLANCILAAHVHLGIIPPQNFDTIPCDNVH